MIICVVGPTGVGKTKLSVLLAQKYKGIIINADAVSIYRELNIGSAKVKEEEKMGIPHYLLDIKNPDEDYSVADYQKDLRELLNKYKGKNIIIVGGTGLYIKASLYDYSFSEMNNNDYTKYSNAELLKMCQDIDPDINIHPNNRRRLENFLNRVDKTKKEPKTLYNVKYIGLTTDRDTLYTKINNRVDEMIKDGLVEEVKSLLNKYGTTNILKRAIGYKEIVSYINKEISLEEAIDTIKKNSRHYAKRQYTWFNNQMPVTWINVDYQNFNKTYEEVINYIEKDC